MILAILVLNGLLGFVQEYRAEQAMAALKAMAAPVVCGRRGGRVEELPAAEVVPGDLVLLGPGDLLAADLRLTESWALRVNEAALTGESEPLTKQAEPLPGIDESMLANRRNMPERPRRNKAAVSVLPDPMPVLQLLEPPRVRTAAAAAPSPARSH